MRHHTTTGVIGSVSAVCLSYINVDFLQVYEGLVEILRFTILLFGALTAILTFYSRFIKKKNKDKEKELI